MRISHILMAMGLAFSASAFAGDAKAPPQPPLPSKNSVPLAQGVKMFNLFVGANRLFLAMKIGANASDEQFLDSMAEKYKAERLPRAVSKGDYIWLAGLDKPIKAVDLAKGIFSYGGKTFDVNFKDGIEQNLETISKIVFPRAEASWISWILPEAYAFGNPNDNSMVGMASILGVGSLAMGMNNCMGVNSSDGGCFMSGLFGGAAAGIALELLMGRNDPVYPQAMNCYPGQNGCSQVQLIGPNRIPINTVSQCPGQGYSYNPALAQVPGGQQQLFGSQLSSMCSYPGMMSNVNAAYGAPLLVPLQQTALVRPPVAAPIFLPGSAAKPASTGAIKPAAVKPAIAPAIKTQTPADPAGAVK